MDRHFDVPANPANSPDNVHIRSFNVEQYLNCRSLYCTHEITDSNAISDAEFVIEDQEGIEVGCNNLIGLANNTVMFTVHIREPTQIRCFPAKVSLTYPNEGLVDQKLIGYSIPHASTPE